MNKTIVLSTGTAVDDVSIARSLENGMQLRSATANTKQFSKTVEEANNNLQHELIKSPEPSNPVSDMKQLISKLAALCDMTVVQDELLMVTPRTLDGPTAEDLKSAKKKFLKSFDKERLKKMKEVLKMKKGKQKKQQLRSLLAESGFSNEQLLLLAQDTHVRRKRISWRSIPEGPRKEAMLKEHRKALRLKTQERQQKLLEMAEMLKRNQTNDPGFTVVSKTGGKKCVLHKSSVSVISHSTQQLSLENINEVAESLSGKTKKILVQSSCQDMSKDQMKLEYSRRTCVKKKMRQIIAKILSEVSDAGYRVIVTSTIGSEAGSHSAELSVVPIKIDDFLPETKESDVKPELSEEEYAKQLEREQILEKQQANEEKMKETEIKLLRILTGAEEIFIPTRKRYNKGEPRPSDAERMKEYRKKLKQDPEKYQMYKQKRAMNKKRRRLSELAAKLKVNSSGPSVTVIPAAPVNEESHGSQSMGTLVSITQPVGGVSIHCPQVYEHPSSHQPTASVVSVHHTTQYVGQVSGIHATHQHQQPIAYGNDMDIVELIAATHSVQNQHFG